MEVKDSNGNILNDGDSVHVIKNIRLTSSSDEVECRVGKSTIVLKAVFLKKA